MMVSNKMNSQMPLEKIEPKSKVFPATELNNGNNNATRNKAKAEEIKLYNIASVINCFINWPFKEPRTFLIPTSFALIED